MSDYASMVFNSAFWVSFMLLYAVVVCWLFKKKSFRNTLTVSHSLDPDQDRFSVGLDLDTNCFPRSSVDDKSQLARNELKALFLF